MKAVCTTLGCCAAAAAPTAGAEVALPFGVLLSVLLWLLWVVLVLLVLVLLLLLLLLLLSASPLVDWLCACV